MKLPPMTFVGTSGAARDQVIACNVCRILGIEPQELWGPSRRSDIREIRQFVSYYLYKNGMNISDIIKITKRNHATVIHSVKVIDDEISVNSGIYVEFLSKMNSSENTYIK